MIVPTVDPESEGSPPQVERCDACGRAWLVQRGFCPHCGARQTRSEAVSGEGRVEAVTVVHRSVQDSAIGPAPYGIALVTLVAAPEVRVMALTPAPLAIGDAVTVSRHGERGAPYLAWPLRDCPAPSRPRRMDR